MPCLDSIIKNLKCELGWKLAKPLHFRDLKPGKKEIAIARIASYPALYRAISVLVHKPSLADPEVFQAKHRLYFYATRYLLERATWLCRDSVAIHDRAAGDGTAKVIFSNRADLPYDEMRNYFEILARTETSGEWSIIRPRQFKTLTNGKHAGLQIADAVASAFYCADHHCLNNKSYRWAEALKPVVYRRHGLYRGYGVKIFPAEAEKQIAQGTLAPWANAVYPV